MKIAAAIVVGAAAGVASVLAYHRLTSDSRDAAPSAPHPAVEPEHTTAHTHA